MSIFEHMSPSNPVQCTKCFGPKPNPSNESSLGLVSSDIRPIDHINPFVTLLIFFFKLLFFFFVSIGTFFFNISSNLFNLYCLSIFSLVIILLTCNKENVLLRLYIS